jgi:hypothetical protein
MIFTAMGSCFKCFDLQDLKNAIRDENAFSDTDVRVLCFMLDNYKVVVTTNTLCLTGEHTSDDFEPTFEEEKKIQDVSCYNLKLITFETDDEPFQ